MSSPPDAKRPPAGEPTDAQNHRAGDTHSIPHTGICVMACAGHACSTACLTPDSLERFAAAVERIADRLDRWDADDRSTTGGAQ